MEETDVRKNIEKTLLLLGDENHLKNKRPDLFKLWEDYIHRKGAENTEDYRAKYNRWILHYFILHGKN